LIQLSSSQDPAPGWLGYATAQCPSGTKITHMEAYWNVGALPVSSEAFYSPWFGIDTSDNLNLLQPVNPWFGSSPWQMYTEYFQWSNGYNSNSDSYNVSPGDLLYGKVTYLGDSQQAYFLSQNDTVTGGRRTNSSRSNRNSSKSRSFSSSRSNNYNIC